MIDSRIKDKKKLKLYKEIERKTGVLSTPTLVKEYYNLVASGFPSELYNEWKRHCVPYNDIHWVKIWSDHLKAQAYDAIVGSSVKETEPEQEVDENENIPLIGDPDGLTGKGDGETDENGKIK